MEPFEVFAIRYGHLGNRHPGQSYILADPHEYGPDLDYFVWVVRRSDCMFVVDTGFAEESAIRRKREHLRSPVDALRLLNIDPDKVTDVILTHLHYDHAGNLDRFPAGAVSRPGSRGRIRHRPLHVPPFPARSVRSGERAGDGPKSLRRPRGLS